MKSRLWLKKPSEYVIHGLSEVRTSHQTSIYLSITADLTRNGPER